MGDSDEYFISNCEKLYDNFVKQDYENIYFDTVFCVQGKELYAYSSLLAQASSVFNEMFIRNRLTRTEIIIIDDYSYDEFFKFLKCIYYPFDDLEIDDNDIFVIVELTELYNTKKLKQRLYLNIDNDDDIDVEQVFNKIELAYKYSFDEYNVRSYVGRHIYELTGFDGFVHLDKYVLEAFVFFTNDYHQKAHEICKAIYKWGEHQAMISEEMTEKEKNELVLNEIKDFLKDINFGSMPVKFLFDFAIKKDLISIENAVKNSSEYNFSETEDFCKMVYEWGEKKAMIMPGMTKDERNELVLNEIKYYIPLLKLEKMRIKFLNDFVVKNGLIQAIDASKYKQKYIHFVPQHFQTLDRFVDEYGIYDVSLNYRLRMDVQNKHKACCKNHKFKIPSTPSPVQKMKGCEWYLLLEKDGTLAIKHESLINKKDDYLIAELKSTRPISFVPTVKIYLHVSHEKH